MTSRRRRRRVGEGDERGAGGVSPSEAKALWENFLRYWRGKPTSAAEAEHLYGTRRAEIVFSPEALKRSKGLRGLYNAVRPMEVAHG